MKPRTMILLVVAVICGLAASWMTTKLVAGRQPTEPTVDIWVVKQPEGIQQNTKIDKPDDLFERKRILEKDVPKAALRAEDADKQLKNKFLNKFLAQGQFVTEKDFLGRGNELTPPPGKVAAGIKVDAERAVGGFVQPNSRVDVIWLEELKESQRKRSKIVLQDVLVLAVDHTTVRAVDKSTTGVANVSTITVAVTPEEATKLGFWQDRGKIRLTLRSPDDERLYKTEGTESALDPATVQAIKTRDTGVEVLVAAQDLEPNTALAKGLFKTKRFPREEAPKNALTWNELEGKTLYQPVATDDIVTRLDLEPPHKEKAAGNDADAGKPEEPAPTRKIIIIDGFKVREVDVNDPTRSAKDKKSAKEKGKK